MVTQTTLFDLLKLLIFQKHLEKSVKDAANLPSPQLRCRVISCTIPLRK